MTQTLCFYHTPIEYQTYSNQCLLFAFALQQFDRKMHVVEKELDTKSCCICIITWYVTPSAALVLQSGVKNAYQCNTSNNTLAMNAMNITEAILWGFISGCSGKKSRGAVKIECYGNVYYNELYRCFRPPVRFVHRVNETSYTPRITPNFLTPQKSRKLFSILSVSPKELNLRVESILITYLRQKGRVT